MDSSSLERVARAATQPCPQYCPTSPPRPRGRNRGPEHGNAGRSRGLFGDGRGTESSRRAGSRLLRSFSGVLRAERRRRLVQRPAREVFRGVRARPRPTVRVSPPSAPGYGPSGMRRGRAIPLVPPSAHGPAAHRRRRPPSRTTFDDRTYARRPGGAATPADASPSNEPTMCDSEKSGPSSMGATQIRPASTISRTSARIAMTFTAVGIPRRLPAATASRR